MPDWDNVFKYCTPKYVYIRDAKLGIMKFFFMGVIFLYVIAYEIMYSCTHLIPHHAQGFGTVNLVQPIEECAEGDRDCLDNFHNVAHLPYCKQYSGDSESKTLRKLASDPEEDGADKEAKGDDDVSGEEKDADEESIGKTITKQKMCQYLDHNRLEFNQHPSEAFIPTHYRRIKQKIDPNCYNPLTDDVEKGADKTKYLCKTIWKTTEVNDYYVADIESFKLKMFHSFNSPTIQMSGVSTDFQGFFAACPSNHPKDVTTECKRIKIPNTSGATAPEDLAGLSSTEELGIDSLTGTKSGEDEITLRDLLKTTPAAQDHKMQTPLDAEFPDDLGHPGKSLREVGGILLLDVNYANHQLMRPGFHGLLGASLAVKPVTYMYRPYFIPSRENRVNQLIQVADDASSRIVDNWYGITIKFQFNGQLVKFTWQGLLKTLTTALVLVTMASTIVCMLAANVMPLKEKYSLLMYQLSEDFSDYHTFRSCVTAKGAADWKALQAARPEGKLLLDKLGALGESVSELSNEELVQILCLMEMRMNRLDGQDPKLVFAEGDEDNPVNKAIGRLQKKFYQDSALASDTSAMETMSFNSRLGKAAE